MSRAPKGCVIPSLLTVLLALSGMGATPPVGMGQDIVPIRFEAATPEDTTLVSDLLAIIPARMEADGVPGLNILILRSGQVVWRASFGWADPDGGRPLELDAVFRAESISKPVTAWGVMRLAQDGVLDLDAPVQEQLRRHTLPPEIPPLTPRQLLSHTAGVGLGDYTDRHPPGGPRPTLEESLAGELSMVGDPGQAFSYSDTGFNLLELLVQDVTGHDFADWMDRTVLDPLGMSEAGYDWDPGARARVPTAHTLRGQPVEPYVYPGRASGGLFATLDDIGRFARAGSPSATSGRGAVDNRPGVLADSSIALLHTPVARPRGLYGIVAEGYGLGHFTEVLSDGRRAVWHGGQGHGWMTHFHLIPETGDGIVLLANSQRAWPLFAHVLRAWSGSLGVDPVRMARITWAAPLAWTVIAVLLAGALALTIGVLRRLGRGRRAARSVSVPARSIAIRLLALAAGLALLGGVIWAATQEYLFLFSILPSTTGWLGLATVFHAAALIVWAAVAGRPVRQHPQDPSPVTGPAASGSSGTVLVVLAAIVSSVAEPARAQEALAQLEGAWMPASAVTRSLSGPATEAQVRIVRGSALMPLAFRQGGVLMVPRISGSRVGVVPRPIDPAEPVWVEALYDLDLELLAQGLLCRAGNHRELIGDDSEFATPGQLHRLGMLLRKRIGERTTWRLGAADGRTVERPALFYSHEEALGFMDLLGTPEPSLWERLLDRWITSRDRKSNREEAREKKLRTALRV